MASNFHSAYTFNPITGTTTQRIVPSRALTASIPTSRTKLIPSSVSSATSVAPSSAAVSSSSASTSAAGRGTGGVSQLNLSQVAISTRIPPPPANLTSANPRFSSSGASTKYSSTIPIPSSTSTIRPSVLDATLPISPSHRRHIASSGPQSQLEAKYKEEHKVNSPSPIVNRIDPNRTPHLHLISADDNSSSNASQSVDPLSKPRRWKPGRGGGDVSRFSIHPGDVIPSFYPRDMTKYGKVMKGRENNIQSARNTGKPRWK